MAAYRRVYDSRHPQADCQEPASVLEPDPSMGYLYLFYGGVLIKAVRSPELAEYIGRQ